MTSVTSSTTEKFGSPTTPFQPDQRHPMLKLSAMIRHHWWLAGLVILAGVLKYALAIATAVTSAYVVGLAVEGHGLSALTPWLWVLAIFVMGQAAATWLDSWMAHDLAYRSVP